MPDQDWGTLKRIRRRLTAPIYRLPDSLPILRTLRTHILICGYPRAGTTLLLAMLEYALPEARQFGKETPGWRAATYCWRNHHVMISKVPRDLLVLDKLREFYRNRPGTLKPIITVRDPRDVLTSRHSSYDRPYFLSLAEWRKRHQYYLIHRDHPDTLEIKYEQLVQDVNRTQKRIEAFTEEKIARPLADFHLKCRPDFDQRPLNGWRPLDNRGIGRWRKPEHARRIRQILQQMPDLPEILIDMGYESNRQWAGEYR